MQHFDVVFTVTSSMNAVLHKAIDFIFVNCCLILNIKSVKILKKTFL